MSDKDRFTREQFDACPANPTNKMCYLPGEYCCDAVRYLQKENARLRARLDAVIYACEQARKLVSQISMPMKRKNGLCFTDPMIATGLNMVICAAREESKNENK